MQVGSISSILNAFLIFCLLSDFLHPAEDSRVGLAMERGTNAYSMECLSPVSELIGLTAIAPENVGRVHHDVFLELLRDGITRYGKARIEHKSGVSGSTISKILHGVRAYSENTRKSILAALKDLDENPPVTDESLREKLRGLVAAYGKARLWQAGRLIPRTIDHILAGGNISPQSRGQIVAALKNLDEIPPVTEESLREKLRGLVAAYGKTRLWQAGGLIPKTIDHILAGGNMSPLSRGRILATFKNLDEIPPITDDSLREKLRGLVATYGTVRLGQARLIPKTIENILAGGNISPLSRGRILAALTTAA